MDMGKQLTEDALYLLLNARTIVDLEGWTRMVSARNHNEHPVHVSSPEAVKFCMMGALCFSRPENLTMIPVINRAIDALEKGAGATSVARFNDAPKRTKKQVLAAFDKAIASLETKIERKQRKQSK